MTFICHLSRCLYFSEEITSTVCIRLVPARSRYIWFIVNSWILYVSHVKIRFGCLSYTLHCVHFSPPLLFFCLFFVHQGRFCRAVQIHFYFSNYLNARLGIPVTVLGFPPVCCCTSSIRLRMFFFVLLCYSHDEEKNRSAVCTTAGSKKASWGE